MILIQVMLAVFGVGHLIRALRVRNLDHSKFTGVRRTEVEQWQELYMKSCYWFTGSAIVVFALSFFWLPHVKRNSTDENVVLAILGGILFIGVAKHTLMWWAAAKLKKSIKARPGVTWPD